MTAEQKAFQENFNRAYAAVNEAADLTQRLYVDLSVNHTIPREKTLKLKDLCREASCAALMLDELNAGNKVPARG